jgi:tetratricopeptide (TPR) repeat protein
MIRSSMPEGEGPPQGRERQWPLALVQREVVLVFVLVIIAAVMFGGTRALAEWSHETVQATATRWFEDGQALIAEGHLDDGVLALRKAVARDRLNPAYVLALARALIDASQEEEAQRLLLQLREREPDRPEVNFRLARLAARRGDLVEATRYYNHAMYGAQPDDPRFDRRRIRLEFATFLLDQGHREDALGELAALGREVPDTADDHMELARLFLRAGDARAAPDNGHAAAGAGEAAFALGSFQEAERHLQAAIRLDAASDALRARLGTTRRVREINPLAPGLRSAERARRVRAGLAWASERLASCAPDGPDVAPAPPDPRREEIDEFRRQPLDVLREPETVAAGVDLLRRGVGRMRRCPERHADEAAWLALAALRGPGGTGG